MDDNVFPSDNILNTHLDSAMDLDSMDELLLDGCWLETSNGSEFVNTTSFPSSSYSSLFDFSFSWPASETNETTWSMSQSQEETQARRWWIAPTKEKNSVMQRIVQALGYIKDFTKEKDALIQLWVPVQKEGKRVLTTIDQPFSHDPTSKRLAHYREISANYQFPAEEDSKDLVGLPGRVFLGKVPEWTPDVQFFKSEEYPRVSDAQKFDVRGTLAIPVFEQGSKTCLGVIEFVMTTPMVKSRTELENICKALEAVDLRSSEVPSAQNVKAHDLSYQAALPEIRELLKRACETHKLPLAQTWVPCIQQGRGGSRHSDENYFHCVSTVDDACYLTDPNIHGFHEACSEHHLLKGQGVAGKAFTTNQPCFSDDIASFERTEYPLSHHARLFNLHAAVAIRLRCIDTGTFDFVLEFFLPVDCRDPQEQRRMLGSLSVIIQEVCRKLRVVTDEELEEKIESPISEVIEKPRKMFGEEDVKVEGSSLSSVGMGRIGEKRRTKAEKTITLEVLQQYFAGSLKDAAKSIGVCPTTLKRICRQHGIKRWPSRKIKKVGHSLQKIQRVIDSVQGVSGPLQIGSFYTSFPELSSPKPQNTKPSPNPQPPSKTKSHSSYSQSSSSSQCCSSGTQQELEDPTVEESQEVKNPLVRTQSHNFFDKQPSLESLPAFDVDPVRIKVSYGDENIRFRVHSSRGYDNLLTEIARRFNIDEMNMFSVKYLDDDLEWVLITCDADLEECIDVFRSCQNHTIKLSLQPSYHLWERSSGSSGRS